MSSPNILRHEALRNLVRLLSNFVCPTASHVAQTWSNAGLTTILKPIFNMGFLSNKFALAAIAFTAFAFYLGGCHWSHYLPLNPLIQLSDRCAQSKHVRWTWPRLSRSRSRAHAWAKKNALRYLHHESHSVWYCRAFILAPAWSELQTCWESDKGVSPSRAKGLTPTYFYPWIL